MGGDILIQDEHIEMTLVEDVEETLEEEVEEIQEEEIEETLEEDVEEIQEEVIEELEEESNDLELLDYVIMISDAIQEVADDTTQRDNLDTMVSDMSFQSICLVLILFLLAFNLIVKE